MAEEWSEWVKAHIVCPACGMSTWIDNQGCALPGCDGYRVLIHDEQGESEEPE